MSARDIQILDPIPADTKFQAGSMTTTGDYISTNSIDDGANGTDGQLPDHDTLVPGNIIGEIDLLNPDTEVSFSFVVDIDDTINGGTVISNICEVQGDLDSEILTNEKKVSSNKTIDSIPYVYNVNIIDNGTITLGADEQVSLVIEGRIPGGASADQILGATLSVVSPNGDVDDLSTGDGLDGLDNTNEIKATVTSNAVLKLSKASSSEFIINFYLKSIGKKIIF